MEILRIELFMLLESICMTLGSEQSSGSCTIARAEVMSWYLSSVSTSQPNSSMIMEDPSLEVEVIDSTSVMPERADSIFWVTISSTSSGEASG